MTGIFKVTYFDPRERAVNMHAVTVIAANAEEAIRKANKLKLLKRYRVEQVFCFGFSDE